VSRSTEVHSEKVRVGATSAHATTRALFLSLATLVTAGVFVSPVAAQRGGGPPPTDVATNDVPIHDPVLIESEGNYYLYGTGGGITSWMSSDLQSWDQIDRVHASTPEWILGVLPEFRGGMWAPDIIEHEGTFYLYYAVSAFGRNRSAIGVATNTTLDPSDPAFEWVDQGMVVASAPGRDMWNAIDANVVFDEEGTPWMDFGSHWGGIKIVKLDPSLTSVAQPEEWHTVAARNRFWMLDERDAGDSANPELDYESLYPEYLHELNTPPESENSAIEAPIIFHKDGWYYLFVSWDRCCSGVESTYKVVVGRSQDIRGPYLDRTGENMAWGGGSLVIQGLGEEDSRWAAGGHNDAVTLNGTDYLVYHAYDKTDGGASKLVIHEIQWDRHGWPTVEADVP